ncbi:MAG TPA: ATP synthase subunit I [Polyangiaceae bacterium]|nr:ATP synthase subunit I [Polyangiaceae bacterium]
MNDVLTLPLASVAGLLLGAFFFGGLWWTVQKGASSKQPALWFFASVVVRMGAALGGFYFVSAGHSERLLSCLFGFFVASLLVTRFTRPKGEEARHASHAG